ncbi:MAG: hypothetical protein HYX61_01615 [Gammaproteobacteria bacterium]|jgi:hypothetical protein|nr:hypothetical protein [Gammaproteobacteria bacterium]
MNQDEKERLIALCEQGRFNEFNSVFASLEMKQKMDFIQADNFYCFHFFASKGYTNILEEMVKCIFKNANAEEWDEDEALIFPFEARQGEGFKKALENHHIETVKFFLDEDFTHLHNKCVEIIIENTQYISLVYQQPTLKCLIPEMINFACYCDLETLKRVLSVLPIEVLMEVVADSAWGPFEIASYNNAPDIISYLWSQCSERIQRIIIRVHFPQSLIVAAKNANTEAIQAILALLGEKQKIEVLSFEDYNTFVYAADRGALAIVKLIWEALPQAQRIEALNASNFAAYRLATQNRQAQVVSFLESITPEIQRKKMKEAVLQTVSKK